MQLQFVAFYLYTLAVGLTSAGLVATGHDAITNKKASFQTRPDGLLHTLGQILVVVWGGPYIILRNLMMARRIERRPIGYLIAGSSIAALWGFFAGAAVLSFAERFV